MEGFDDSDIDLIQASEDVDAAELAKASEDAPGDRLVNLVLTNAVPRRNLVGTSSSRPTRELPRGCRIDGVLYKVMKPPLKLKSTITSRLEDHVEPDIAERRVPQDGRLQVRSGEGATFACRSCRRSSARRSCCGSSTVRPALVIDKLGFEQNQPSISSTASPPAVRDDACHGTDRHGQDDHALFGAVRAAHDQREDLSTTGDPVEYELKGIGQVQINENQARLRGGAPLRAAPGPRRHPGRRNTATSRPRGSPCRPRSPVTWSCRRVAHQRCDVDGQPHARPRHRAVRGRLLGELHRGAAAGPPRVRGLQGDGRRGQRAEALVEAGLGDDVAREVAPVKGRGCRECSETGYKGGFARSTK